MDADANKVIKYLTEHISQLHIQIAVLQAKLEEYETPKQDPGGSEK